MTTIIVNHTVQQVQVLQCHRQLPSSHIQCLQRLPNQRAKQELRSLTWGCKSCLRLDRCFGAVATIIARQAPESNPIPESAEWRLAP